MRNGEPQIYSALATMRNGYMQTQWNRIQMFLVFNSIAFPFAFGLTQAAEITTKAKMFISMMAFCLHVVLINGTLRADKWIKYLDCKLSELEQADGDSDNSVRTKIFSDPIFDIKKRSVFANRRLFGAGGLAVMMIWLVMALIFADKYFDAQIL